MAVDGLLQYAHGYRMYFGFVFPFDVLSLRASSIGLIGCVVARQRLEFVFEFSQHTRSLS